VISSTTKYVLREGTIILLDKDTLQLSYGVWNYRALSVEFKPSWSRMMERFTRTIVEGGVSIQGLKEEFNLNTSDIDELQDLFEQLQSGGFIYSKDFIDQSISGSFLLLGFSELQTLSLNDDKKFKEQPQPPKVAIFTTISKLKENLLLSHYKKWLDINLIDLNDKIDLFQYNSTERTNATELLEFINSYKNLSTYETALVILDYPNPTLLRNLNRIFIHYGIPWILATLDGPFIMMTSFVPEHTACLECLELRIISQMRSIQEYKSFVSRLNYKTLSKEIEFIPVLQIPLSIAMNELILLSNLKASHFVGRLLSIYLPFFEIQMQDLLRIPICPACGHTSKPTMNELYFDFRRFVSDVTKKIQ
jgi:thiazole/oxazole-forming peptide maturase SagC family component